MTDTEQPSQNAWEDRCTDCDDTGVTIQTERRCACKPPVQAEQPEQWAVELWAEAYHQTHLNGKRFAALTIQRAFAEREAELVGALRGVISELEHKGNDGWMTGNVHGDDYDRATAALKSHEAGHG